MRIVRLTGLLQGLCWILIVLTLVAPVTSVVQGSPLKIVMEQYQWTDDMIRLKVTTPEQGLVIGVSFSNTHEEYSVRLSNVQVRTHADFMEEGSTGFHDTWSASGLFLPPKTNSKTYIRVDFQSGMYRADKSVIGRWKVEVAYKIERQEWIDERGYIAGEGALYVKTEDKLEPYPLELRIVSSEQFQKEIQQGQRPLLQVNIGQITIQIVSLGSITILSVALYFYLRRRSAPRLRR